MISLPRLRETLQEREWIASIEARWLRRTSSNSSVSELEACAGASKMADAARNRHTFGRIPPISVPRLMVNLPFAALSLAPPLYEPHHRATNKHGKRSREKPP